MFPIHSGNIWRSGLLTKDKYCKFCSSQIDSGKEAIQPTKLIAVNSLNLPMSFGIFKESLSFDVFLNVNLFNVCGKVAKNSSNPYNAINLEA